ncbi:Sec-independent protein translocase protein TatB [Vibrio sp.]|uniref:Sec-independent protein translocase protein TatB n=1 Tax=Vibrio viridaestus TaxID=2487322 RepID=A0A3N9TCA1_9VIBR|nr:Sec-independent protein translocase protein TatB [Vibrio viridaestus]MDC0611191.1 Sec-independent protein translocase protein TatB [Vibrio sp.]RQW61454.1 Sec-independent protein translocase subunit TatB [Vibrio viridaestus]
MFDIGFWELVLIFIIGLVVLGPEKLPNAIRSVMKFTNAVRQTANSVKNELSQELKLKELQDDLKQSENLGLKELSSELHSSVDSFKKSVTEVQSSYERPASGKENQEDDSPKNEMSSDSKANQPHSKS